MSDTISISVVTAKEELTISGLPEGLAFSVQPNTQEFVVPAEPNQSVIADSGIVDYDLTLNGTPSASVLNLAPALELKLGTIPINDLYDELNSFKYLFPNFIDSTTGSLEAGDIVILKEDIGYNSYNASCVKVDTSDVYGGAFNTLYIFIKHDSNNDLVLISRGYFDLPDSKIQQWTGGRTLYIDSQNKFHITPSSILTDGWVRSVGYCVTNNENKKRIWFEPDSTFIKIN